MQYPIKLHIKIRRPFGRDWVRYFLLEKLLIEQNGPIRTEQQLMTYIHNRHGTGRFQIIAWAKKHEGFWLFWNGDLYDNGFIRDISKNKELERLQKQHVHAKTYEERQDIEEEMAFEKEISQIDKSTKRRGPIGLEKSKAGVLQSYISLNN